MTTLHAVHEQLGARWEDREEAAGDAPLPRNYGDPAAEYRAAREAAALVDRADRRFIRVHGRDPLRMVQGLVSNDVTGAPADRAVYAVALTPKGKMVADMRIVRRGGELLLEVDRAAAEPLAAHLRKFVPPLFARFEEADGAWGELGVYGPEAAAVLRRVLGEDAAALRREDDVREAEVDDVPVTVLATSYADVPGFDILVPRASLETVWRRLGAAGARPMGHATLDVLRIEAGSPRWGAELDGNTIPLEAGLRERAISETKGCYTGQEVIIRILHRGHVNRLLRGVLLGDAAAPARDAALVRPGDGRNVGRITSAAWSPKHGQTIALAYVRREVDLPATLHLATAGGPEVTVTALPFPDA